MKEIATYVLDFATRAGKAHVEMFGETNSCSEQIEKLARHVLACSQCDADGDEPVTSELMRSLGAKPNHWPAGTVDWDIPSDDCVVIVRIWSEEIKSLPDLILSNCGDSGDFQWPIENVRHLRKALDFLGIKTTQQPGDPA